MKSSCRLLSFRHLANGESRGGTSTAPADAQLAGMVRQPSTGIFLILGGAVETRTSPVYGLGCSQWRFGSSTGTQLIGARYHRTFVWFKNRSPFRLLR